MYPQMNPYHVVIYRGGTSKGILFAAMNYRQTPNSATQ